MRAYLSLGLAVLVIIGGFDAAAQDKQPIPLKLDDQPFSDSLQSRGRESKKPSDEALLKQARQQLAAKRRKLQYEENAAFWRDQIEKSPGTPHHYRRLLYTLNVLGECDEVGDVATRLLQIEPLDDYALSALGGCFYERGQFDKAIQYFEPSAWYNPSDFQTQRALGYCFYHLKRYRDATVPLQRALDLQPHDFFANYSLGWCLIQLGKMSEAVDPLLEAVRLRPDDYWANHASGLVLLRAGRYQEAISHLEKAIAVRKSAMQSKVLLFTAYLLAGEFNKASALFPIFVTVMAVLLTAGYLFGLIPLLFFSFKSSGKDYPNILLAFGWLVVFMEGQIAFIFVLAQLPWLSWIANALGAVLLAGLPLLIAVIGFMRQRWGEPFQWPARFGTPAVISTSFLLLLGTYMLNLLLVHPQRNAGPLQNTVPIFKEALHHSPWLSYLIIAIAIPAIEEVLFRGLLFGSIRRWLAPLWSVIVVALIFAAFHLQPPAFVQLFLLGCLLGWARARTGSVALPILLHIFNNSLAVVGLLSGKM